MQIQKLSGHVIDQIAAGEVIERPAQLVKEVIENSLDAGAQSVELSLNSNLSQIIITDDGRGVLKEDLGLVFERHSTSKIKSADELFALDSFGFRGEALSAIGSVSKVSLETKNQSDDKGSLYIWDSGQEVLKDDSEIETGTKISISQLFDNVPARKKFLKSQRHELNLVKKVFSSFALVHFEKSFKLLIDGKLSALYPEAKSFEERYAQVYNGKKVYKIEIPESEFILKGSCVYLEEPSIEAKTSNSLWIFVQQRWIQDKTIAAAVREGLNTYLMHGCFPKGFVDLHLKPDFVDVNVHPMKSQVRYQDSSFIYKSLRHAVAEWAKLSPWQGEIIKKDPVSYSEPAFYKPVSRPTRQESIAAVQVQTGFELKDAGQVQYKKTYGDLKSKKIEKLLKTEDGFEPSWSKLQVIGQVNLTYIVAQAADAVYFIDQHAAHERVGYEKLLISWRNRKQEDVQSLLIPLSIDMEENEIEALLSQQKDLEALGLGVEQAGPNTLVINSIPAILKEEAVDGALRKLAYNIDKFGGGSSVEEIFELFFATVSCHSVIRAGHAMSEDEMRLLLIEMDKYKSNYCPHGRPVYKKISFDSLDRDFGRSL